MSDTYQIEQILERREYLNRIAISDGNLSYRYRDLATHVRKFARWLARQDARVVALYGDNSIEWVVVDLACQLAGIVCVPLPTFFSRDQLEHCLADTDADILIWADKPESRFQDMGLEAGLDEGRCEALTNVPLAEFVAFRRMSGDGVQMPEGTQKITYTSGSTGRPKGVCLSATHQWRVAASLVDRVGIAMPRHLCLLPLSTLLENIAGVYAPLLAGGMVVVAGAEMRGLSGSSGLQTETMMRCIVRMAPSTLIVLPQLLSALVMASRQGLQPPDSLRCVAVGGAPVSTDLIREARTLGWPVVQGYGLSECGSVVALARPSDRIDGTGRVLPHLTVRIENNELRVSGNTFLGYLGDVASWHQPAVLTGDLGYISDQEVFIQGRRKNQIITGFGRNISPEWVERELTRRPLFNHCIVGGNERPDLFALVSAPDSVSDQMLSSWIARVNESLPDYARVGRWQRIPVALWQGLMTSNGKPRREAIFAAFADTIDQLYARPSGLESRQDDALQTDLTLNVSGACI